MFICHTGHQEHNQTCKKVSEKLSQNYCKNNSWKIDVTYLADVDADVEGDAHANDLFDVFQRVFVPHQFSVPHQFFVPHRVFVPLSQARLFNIDIFRVMN